MKNYKYLLICPIFLFHLTILLAQVGIGTTNPRAALEINSTKYGFLPPQVALTASNLATPVVNPQTGTLINGTIVYNTATAGIDPNHVTPGYYFWNGNLWLKINSSDTSKEIEDDLRVTIDKGSNSAQLGSLTGVSGPQIWFFRDGSGIEAMSFSLQLPHNWKEGSTIHPHIHWVPRNSGTGNVQWNLDYSWADLDTTTPKVFPATTTSSVIASGPFVQNMHLLTPLTTGDVGIDATGKHISSVLVCRIWRDSGLAGDTYNQDAGGLSMDFHITIIDPFVD
ncbi:MAG: hypothetical protein COZ75_05975 [Flavobacteriaceae bacterium CG_4_8_14_3_um_filter_34_10]|nr:hypothetical protein [Flavobacteriia bacterium]PIQ17921.1 MAG: hypothetical protein COW66_09175 [Flavobacteriaceae bacterium CG18_big_fil_WC_8_21_14_2_50_34_36]PIV49487.1 MAG: hypothetical protein COS19_08395 [Flavobacteriaceae bacterium CG02_land_8_20_14_3_00_34_13]PIX09584.1 MAG: hypothetical protein COZ75_05975 [Flavobacteriaceae bacterium CG_4_8_14_3_um_filter_34_10]PIZ09199.1 MAG: hypothetical protein COY56_00060 [Flavobacteriaceae bacterium CG_4_10_14_0_8_um_filter_34_31]PJC05963.1 MA